MEILNVKQKELIKPLFCNTNGTFVKSYFDGYHGVGLVDNSNNPTYAQIIVGPFKYIAGSIPNKQESSMFLEYIPLNYKYNYFSIIPIEELWSDTIKNVYKYRYQERTRYAFQHMNEFDIKKLNQYARFSDSVIPIDKKMYETLTNDVELQDLIGIFTNYDDFSKNGFGYCLKHDNVIIAGASSYSRYLNGIEIQINVLKRYKKQGLGLLCGAVLMLNCIKKGLYPSSDSANEDGLLISKALGYKFKNEYKIFDVRCR
ncbi:MAG: GNAT family N-acetyltransferase [Defluviitaleaceae bacterium]|nr:GNAT family N-acetyltransferase [Defluviitaleaceae bacterium]